MTQRPELEMLKNSGYVWSNPFDIMKIFEEKMSNYTGAPYVTVTDCCTHALELCLRYKQLQGESIPEIVLPARTYVSVPMMLKKLGIRYQLKDQHWRGYHYLEPTNVVDMAVRFTKDCYIPNSHCCVSFGSRKVLKINRGGAILTDDPIAHQYFQLARADGRNFEFIPWETQRSYDVLGFHYNLSLDDCARGILLMDEHAKQGSVNADAMDSRDYPDLKEISLNF